MEPEVTPQEQEPVEPAVEPTPVEPNEPAEPEVPEEQTPEQQAQDQFLLRGKVGEEEIVYDLNKDEDRQRILADAQKGHDYTRKTQALAEFEKTNKAKIDAYDQMISNEPLMKLSAAQSMGIDPILLVSEPQAPDQSLQEVDPQRYWQMYAQYQTHKQQKDGFDRYWNQLKIQTGAQQNSIAFGKVKLEKELTAKEAEELELFVRKSIPPNALGVYTDDQILYAYHAKFPGRDQLSNSTKLQTAIKKISTGAPQKVSPKQTKKPAEEQESSSFLGLVKDVVKQREERK